ncbi:hypothetical protein AAY473_008069 [Plecturocebus cupreus]
MSNGGDATRVFGLSWRDVMLFLSQILTTAEKQPAEKFRDEKYVSYIGTPIMLQMNGKGNIFNVHIGGPMKNEQIRPNLLITLNCPL